MRTQDAIDRLDFHQDRIRTTIARSLELVEQPPAVAQAELARHRWTVVRQLREYQVFKHTEIFGPALRCGAAVQAARARVLAERCTALGDRLQAHLQHWAGRDVVAEWDSYKPLMLAMAAEVRRALASERAGVVHLLSGVERTRQRLG